MGRLLALVLAFALAACGGGGGGTGGAAARGGTVSLTGVVAVGTQVPGTNVTVGAVLCRSRALCLKGRR